ncbi:unnamed protein product [Hydatigera taeniaeformis]|uniref:Uncharacterized protein n=1 Tax=Hydatigena taeniaeformis TaxID=6205 RepID=A0A3P7G543_HYDTA|nr:unnamed protein product [Hydatigera taeniaeformis]
MVLQAFLVSYFSSSFSALKISLNELLWAVENRNWSKNLSNPNLHFDSNPTRWLSSAPHPPVSSASPGSPLKTSDGTDRDGLELVNLASSDSGSGTGGVEATVGSRGTSSLVHKAPILLGGVGGSGSGSDAVEQLVGSETSTQSDGITAMLKLHSRLGRILQDACDLHKQIGHLLSTVANQPVH